MKTLTMISLCLTMTLGVFADCGNSTCDSAKKSNIKNKSVAKTVESKQALPTLIDFGASKCEACKKLAPILEKLKKDYMGRLVVTFVDVWKEENESKAEKFEINRIPTQIFFAPDGKELWRHVGFMSEKDILAKWKELGYDLSSKSDKK